MGVIASRSVLVQRPNAHGQQAAVAAVVDVGGFVLLVHSRAHSQPIWDLPRTVVVRGEAFEDAVRRAVSVDTGLTVTRVTQYLGVSHGIRPCGDHTLVHTFSVAVSEEAQEGKGLARARGGFTWVGAGDDPPVSGEVSVQLLRHFCAARGRAG